MGEDGFLAMLRKATLTNLATLESLEVLWNPEAYWVRRTRRPAAPGVSGSGGAFGAPANATRERFSTRLFFDTTELERPARDSRLQVERLESWARPEPSSGAPPEVLFSWGSFRFRGAIEDLSEEWVLFDPDGTPTRGWVGLTLRR